MSATSPSQPSVLTPGAFSATVSAITSAFGDPTRRQIYLFAHDSPQGITAAHVADHFGLHPNVARHHLDKLAAGGYLEVAVERSEGAAARARPRRPAPTTARRPGSVIGGRSGCDRSYVMRRPCHAHAPVSCDA